MVLGTAGPLHFPPPFDDQCGPVKRVQRLARESRQLLIPVPQICKWRLIYGSCSALGNKILITNFLSFSPGEMVSCPQSSQTRRWIPNMITWRNSRTICQATLFQTLDLVAHEHANGHKPRSLRTRVTSSPSTPRFSFRAAVDFTPPNHQDDIHTRTFCALALSCLDDRGHAVG